MSSPLLCRANNSNFEILVHSQSTSNPRAKSNMLTDFRSNSYEENNLRITPGKIYMFIIEAAQTACIRQSSCRLTLVSRFFTWLNILSQLSLAARPWSLAINQRNCPSPTPVARHQDRVNFLYILVTRDQAGAAAEAPCSPLTAPPYPLNHSLSPSSASHSFGTPPNRN